MYNPSVLFAIVFMKLATEEILSVNARQCTANIEIPYSFNFIDSSS